MLLLNFSLIDSFAMKFIMILGIHFDLLENREFHWLLPSISKAMSTTRMNQNKFTGTDDSSILFFKYYS